MPPAPHRRPRSASRASGRRPRAGAGGAPRTAPPAPRARSRLAFSQLEPVTVGILERCDIAPRVLEHPRLELDAARLQRLDRRSAVRNRDGDRRRDAALYRFGLAGSTRPEAELEVL